jgi:hypothetical protein
VPGAEVLGADVGTDDLAQVGVDVGAGDVAPDALFLVGQQLVSAAITVEQRLDDLAHTWVDDRLNALLA